MPAVIRSTFRWDVATIVIALIAIGAATIDIRMAWAIWLLFVILSVPLGHLYARLLGERDCR